MAKTQKVDTLIIGAGVIGSSVAMHLAQKGVTGIHVVDFDLEGSLSSSELNAGGVRATWFQPVNIQMSKISIEYFASVAQEVGYRPCGYLWLHSEKAFEGALKARERQVQMGWPVEVWNLDELRRRVPFIDKTEGIEGCTFGSRDGLVNPNLLKIHFRQRAKSAGAQFEDRVLVRQVEYGKDGIHVVAEKFESVLSADDKESVLTSDLVHGSMSRGRVEYLAKRVINCAGPWAGEVASILKYKSPAHAVRRQVCIFDCREVDLTQYGMIVDTSGVYFHPEATNGLAGFATHGEPVGKNYTSDGQSFFMEQIWPPLYERSSSFERLKFVTGWAGLYEVSPDESAIIGRVENGDAGKSGQVFEAHSFSGHGVMHSYCAGLLLSELIVDGRYQTWDISELCGKRYELGREVRESMLI